MNSQHSSSEKPSNVRWLILALMIVASFVAYILRTNLSVAGMTMMKDIGFSEIELGMIFSAFTWGYAIFQFPGGIFCDRVGARKAMAVIAFLWGLLTILTGMVPGPSHASVTMIITILIVLRFLVGAVHAPLFPIVGRTIVDWFPALSWGFPNGLTTAGLTLGAAATGPLIVWMVQTYGWRESFLITAPLGFLIAGAWWWYVRDYPGEHKKVNQAERDFIGTDKAPASAEPEKGIWKRTLKNREILLLTISYFCMNYVFYLFFNWLFFYLVDVRKFEQSHAGVMNSVFWIVGSIGATIGGFFCDRLAKTYGPRWGYRFLPVPALILTAALLYGAVIAENASIAVVLFSFAFGFTQVTDGTYWAAMTSVTGRHAAAGGGVLNTGGNAVGGFVALLVPITAKYFGWVAAMATGSVFALIAAMLWLFIRADIPMAAEHNQ